MLRSREVYAAIGYGAGHRTLGIKRRNCFCKFTQHFIFSFRAAPTSLMATEIPRNFYFSPRAAARGQAPPLQYTLLSNPVPLWRPAEQFVEQSGPRSPWSTTSEG